jgi:predicted NBD/HSP70 family sugar kinase
MTLSPCWSGVIVVHCRLHTASAGYALEVGHLTVEPGGPTCHCGNAGCLEVEADSAALLAAANQPVSEPILTAAHAVIAAIASDESARAAVHTITSRLGVGLASLVNVLNPDRVVLGGMHAELLAAAEPALRAILTRRSFLDQATRVDLRPAELSHSSLTGAGELALQPLLDDPRIAAGPMAVDSG